MVGFVAIALLRGDIDGIDPVGILRCSQRDRIVKNSHALT
jgi:hypothetical protein